MMLIGNAAKNKMASIIAIDQAEMNIRAICPNCADAAIASCRDHWRDVLYTDRLDALRSVYRTLSATACGECPEEVFK